MTENQEKDQDGVQTDDGAFRKDRTTEFQESLLVKY